MVRRPLSMPSTIRFPNRKVSREAKPSPAKCPSIPDDVRGRHFRNYHLMPDQPSDAIFATTNQDRKCRGILWIARQCPARVLTPLRAPERPQYSAQAGTRGLQLLEVYLRKRLQLLFALCRQFDEDAPAVVLIHGPAHQPKLRHAVYQFDGGVMPHPEEFREITDGNGPGTGETLDGEQRLMLLGPQPGLMGSRFAEREEFSKPIAKLGESLVVDGMRSGAPGWLCAPRDRRFAWLLRSRLKHPAPPHRSRG
jgi:hypothetical protein